MNARLLQRYQATLVSLIKNRLPNCRIHLLDAHIHADPTSKEDLEIVLDDGRKIPPQIMVMLYDDIDAARMPAEVDIIDAATMSPAEKGKAKVHSICWAE